jgi:hypothetical protein
MLPKSIFLEAYLFENAIYNIYIGWLNLPPQTNWQINDSILTVFVMNKDKEGYFFVPYWEETKCENTMSSHVHLILSHLNLEFCIVNAGSQFCHDIFLVQLDPLSSSCQPPSCLEKTHLLNDSLNGGNSFLLWWNPTRWERIRDENPTISVVILFVHLNVSSVQRPLWHFQARSTPWHCRKRSKYWRSCATPPGSLELCWLLPWNLAVSLKKRWNLWDQTKPWCCVHP